MHKEKIIFNRYGYHYTYLQAKNATSDILVINRAKGKTREDVVVMSFTEEGSKDRSFGIFHQVIDDNISENTEQSVNSQEALDKTSKFIDSI